MSLMLKDHYMIMGRTEACEYIGALIEIFKDIASLYRNETRFIEADIFDKCSELLEKRIEQYANTK